MRERLGSLWRRLGAVESPELTPATWTIAVFLGVVLGDGVRGRLLRGPLAGEADLIALLVVVGFVALLVVLATIVQHVRGD